VVAAEVDSVLESDPLQPATSNTTATTSVSFSIASSVWACRQPA
jgi:hypothetical protein